MIAHEVRVFPVPVAISNRNLSFPSEIHFGLSDRSNCSHEGVAACCYGGTRLVSSHQGSQDAGQTWVKVCTNQRRSLHLV